MSGACSRAPALALAPALAALAACGNERSPLVDVAPDWGVDFAHDAGFRGQYFFPETVCGGVALLDLEGDGDLDLYAVQSGPVPGTVPDQQEGRDGARNRLYRNDAPGRFTDVTEASGGAAHDGYGMGACAGDVSGDGRPDLFVTNLGPDALLVNAGDGAFEERAARTPLADVRWSAGAAFGDLDRDGHLDLYVASYVKWSASTHVDCRASGVLDYCHINLFEGAPDRVWRGDGSGAFEERTADWLPTPKVTGRGLGVALVDLDDDGDVDAYVANDSVENHVFLNGGDGRLEDVTYLSGAAFNLSGRPEAGMGLAVADVDGNALPDLLVTNFAGESNTLYTNAGAGRFQHRSRQARITVHSRKPLGFGIAFADFDRDGIEDLVVGNGHVLRHVQESREAWKFEQPDQLFRGTPDGTFEPWEAGPVIAAPKVTRGLAVGDLDGDGAIDAVLQAHGAPLRIAHNRAALPGSHWLRVRLVGGEGSNTMAIGARVSMVLGDGSVQRRWVRGGTGYLSQDDPSPHFGLPAGAAVERVEVRWPDGSEQVVEGPELDRTLVVRQE